MEGSSIAEHFKEIERYNIFYGRDGSVFVVGWQGTTAYITTSACFSYDLELHEVDDLTPLFELDPGHRYISEDPEELVLWASPALPFEPDKIRIELFTPQE